MMIAISLGLFMLSGCTSRTVGGNAVAVPPLVEDSPADFFRITWSATILDQGTHQLTHHRYTVYGGSTVLTKRETFTSRPGAGFHVFWLVSDDAEYRNISAIGIDDTTGRSEQSVVIYPARGEHTLQLTTEGSAEVGAQTTEPILSARLA